MVYETKIGNIGGSAVSVIPSGLVKLLDIEKGDKMVWDADIDAVGAIVKVTIKKE